MANPLGARKSGSFKAVSTVPSINKTPVGAATPPLPYPVSQDLSTSAGTVNSVRFNGEPAYVLDQTTQPRCTGDEAGSAGGVKSGIVNGEVKPAGASSTVHAGGKRVVREGDPCTLNSGNCPGIYLTTPAPDTTEKPTAETVNPPVQLETEAEKSYYQQAKEALAKAREAAKPGAEYYQKNIAGPLHDFAGDAMDKGMKATAVGEGTMLAGGAVAATGVGAPVAAGMEVIGGAATAVGAGVTAVGGVTEAGATVLDSAADFVLTGELPDMTALALAFAENRLAKKINKLKGMLPGKKGPVKKDIHSGDAPPQTEAGAGGGKKGKDGFKVLGSKKTAGPCDHLRKGSGNGDYRGGAHSATSKPRNDDKDSHHMPSAESSPLKERNDGPAIQMDTKDHHQTSSNGRNGSEARQYRQMIGELLKNGEWKKAMAIEIQDIREIAKRIGNSRKYNEAILEMLEYFKCLKKNGFLIKGQ